MRAGIRVYPKNDSNEWSNVKTWSWVSQNETPLDISDLTSGAYEARLFYHNSYELEAKIAFEHQNNPNNVTREELIEMI